MNRTMGFAVLFASLLDAGCSSSSTGDCSDPPPNDSDQKVTVTSSQLDAADDGGTLDCKALCQPPVDATALSCSDLGPIAGSGGSGGGSGSGGAGGSGADADHEILCTLRTPGYCEGRRHEGVESDSTGRGPTPTAAWLDRAARAEAASVHAFLALHDELAALGAPAELLARSRASAADEVRHARVMRALADRAGAPSAATPAKTQPMRRTLHELALENAVEGCVHETFAGLMAMHQARHAGDEAVRTAMAGIARDEIGHGELAWSVHRWACAQLPADEVAHIQQRLQTAADDLARNLEELPLSAEARHGLGLPSRERARELAEGVRARLWS